LGRRRKTGDRRQKLQEFRNQELQNGAGLRDLLMMNLFRMIRRDWTYSEANLSSLGRNVNEITSARALAHSATPELL
jgi:hypothetical protein